MVRESPDRRWSRRAFLSALVVGGAGALVAFRRKLRARLSRLTRRADFTATPPLAPHDPIRDRRTITVSRGLGPAANLDAVVQKLGGMQSVVGKDDVVLIKVSAQWWNQGMTNVAAVKRAIELVLAVPGFAGEVIVFENTHFLTGGSPLSRAWTRPSDRNVDVPGWSTMGDLIPAFAKEPVSFVGLVDAGKSSLAGDPWHDPEHTHGVYGGDGSGPIGPGELRDGYHWDFAETFRLRKSLVDDAQTPLTWPVLTSPRSGLMVDLRHGIFRRAGMKRVPVEKKLTWITMPTANEHVATGFTCCCKSAMGVVDMSAGALGTHPSVRDYQSIHYFGFPDASWRMAGPLAHFALKVRAPDLYLVTAEWMAAVPNGSWDPEADLRLEAASAHHVGAIVAGRDPVAVDAWCARNLLMPLGGANRAQYDLDDPNSKLSRFLRYYRQVWGTGTLDPALIDAA